MPRKAKRSVNGLSRVVAGKKKRTAVFGRRGAAVRIAQREGVEAPNFVEGGGNKARVRLPLRGLNSTFKHTLSGSKIPIQFMDQDGLVKVQDVADWFGLSKVQLADTMGLQVETLHRVRRAKAPKTQSRVREMLEIVGRIAEWAGGKDQALAWYRAEPLPAFGGRTAEALVKEGKAVALRDYLDHVAVGGFA